MELNLSSHLQPLFLAWAPNPHMCGCLADINIFTSSSCLTPKISFSPYIICLEECHYHWLKTRGHSQIFLFTPTFNLLLNQVYLEIMSVTFPFLFTLTCHYSRSEPHNLFLGSWKLILTGLPACYKTAFKLVLTMADWQWIFDTDILLLRNPPVTFCRL